jgi:uncharacterized protein (TIGR03086 family)
MTETSVSLADLDLILDAATRLVEGVGADQWHAATPCTEWDVRQLVDHVTTGNGLFAAIAGGERPEGPDGMQRLRLRATPAPGDDPVAAFRDAADALRRAFSAPGFLEGRYPTPLGEREGPFLVEMRTTENLVHGWDLSRATGQMVDFPEEATERALEMVRAALAGRPRPMFGAEQSAPEGAPPLDRLAAFLGRRV